jgi:hypothetical protein
LCNVLPSFRLRRPSEANSGRADLRDELIRSPVIFVQVRSHFWFVLTSEFIRKSGKYDFCGKFFTNYPVVMHFDLEEPEFR